MRRDFRSTSFRVDESASAEDADPRVGLVNLADVMLVFACGLMLALVAAWNLDVSALTEVVKADEVTEVTDVEKMTEQAIGAGFGYQELGMVYQDPMTGKLYMLQEDLEGGVEASTNSQHPSTAPGEPTQEPSPSEVTPAPGTGRVNTPSTDQTTTTTTTDTATTTATAQESTE